MARTSRKSNQIAPSSTESMNSENFEFNYKVGGYIRLSVEDNGKEDSDTLEKQKEMIIQYISRDSSFQLCEIYCDNGKTGTNFNRTGFQKMMKDIKSGKINCVVVKDLSRFGRNYIETGMYMEKIFPLLGVRFISINDHYDNLTTTDKSSLLIPLKNMINEAYSKDISKKLFAVFQQQQKEGKIIGRWAAYGYQKCIDNPHKIVIEEEAASTVKRIFQWRAEGKSLLWIARTLNEREIPSPQHYHYLKGEIKSQNYVPSLWTNSAIQTICANAIYTGNMVQHKTVNLQSGVSKRVPKSEWTIVPGTHEAIINQELFDQAQITAKRNRTKQQNDLSTAVEENENLLKGLIFCENCGARMIRNKCLVRGKRYVKYVCSRHRENPIYCPSKTIRESDVLDILWQTIQKQIEMVTEINEIVSKENLSPTQKEINELEKQIDNIKYRRKKALSNCEKLYANYIDGHISLHEYSHMKEKENEKVSATQLELDNLEKSLYSLRSITKEYSCLELYGRFRNQSSLSYEMIHELLEKVQVSDKRVVTITFRFCDEIESLKEFTSRFYGSENV